MKGLTNAYEERQEMQTANFEVFHSISSAPLSIDYHSHDFCEILVFLSGSVTYSVEGKSYHLRPGDIILTNNREIHKPFIKAARPYERYVVWISEPFLTELSGLGGADSALSNCFDSSSRHHYNLLRADSALFEIILHTLNNLMAIEDGAAFGRDILRRCYMGELLVYLNKAYLDHSAEVSLDITYDEKISGILCYINENLCEPLDLDSMAEQFYISKFHFARRFRESTGLSFHRYVIKKRLIAAKRLMQQGCSATQACLGSGFNDYSHFSRSFSKEYGLSPRGYLKKLAEGR